MRAFIISMLLGGTLARAAEAHFEFQSTNIAGTGIHDPAIHLPLGNRQPWLVGADTSNSTMMVYTFDGGALFDGPTSVALPQGLDSRAGLAFTRKSVTALSTAANGVTLFSDNGQTLFQVSVPAQTLGKGVALFRPADAGLEVYVSSSGTALRHYTVSENTTSNRLELQDDATFSLSFVASPHSIVIDDAHRMLYASITNDGVYSWPLDGAGTPPSLAIPRTTGELGAAPAGLATYQLRDGGTLLVIAVPNRSEYAIYNVSTATPRFLARFQVTNDAGTQKVINGEYVEVTQSDHNFPGGVMVVSDHNFTGGLNYKFVPWASIAANVDPSIPVELPRDGGTKPGGTCADGGTSCSPADAGKNDGGGGTGGGGQVGPGPTNPGPTEPANRVYCCGGGPMSTMLPGLVLFGWTFSFRRRRKE